MAPRKKVSTPLWQRPLNSFLSIASGHPYKASRELFKLKLITFRQQYQSQFPNNVYLGSKNHKIQGEQKKIAYYRDADFYHYFAFDISRDLMAVGELRLDSLDEEHGRGEHALSGINVLIPYRLGGIATALINFANITNMTQNNGVRLVVFGGQEYNSRYRLTADGMALIRKCLEKGILEDEQFLGNVSVPSPQG